MLHISDARDVIQLNVRALRPIEDRLHMNCKLARLVKVASQGPVAEIMQVFSMSRCSQTNDSRYGTFHRLDQSYDEKF